MTTALHTAVYLQDGAQLILNDSRRESMQSWCLELVQRASQPDELITAKALLSAQDLIDLHRAVGAALISCGLLNGVQR